MPSIAHLWNNLTAPGASCAPAAPQRAERFFALYCLAAAFAYGLSLLTRAQVDSYIWLVTDSVRVLMVAGAVVLLLRAAPLPVRDAGEERRGRITAAICLCLILVGQFLMWLDPLVYRWPPYSFLYWQLLCAACLTPLLLVRAGRVRLAAALLIAQFALQVLAAAPAGNVMFDASRVPLFALTIVAAGLLLRWWAGLALAPLIPLSLAGLSFLGVGDRPDPVGSITLIVMLTSLAALVALHARSLEAALAAADHNASNLQDALGELKQLTDEVRQSRDALEVVVGGIQDGLALIDGDGRVLLANETFGLLYGRRSMDLVGKPWTDCCGASGAFVARVAAEGQRSGGRITLPRADGAARMIDADCFPAGRTASGHYRVVLHLTDVTERLQLEAMAVQNARLAASGRMAAIVAHEVNSPLQAIQNFLYLASTDDAVERDSYLRLVAEEIDRVGELIRRLLDLHRTEAGAAREVDVNGLVRRVLSLLSGTLSRSRISVSLGTAAELPPLFVNPGQLTQVLLNLCVNAVEAMPGGGVLQVITVARPALAADAFPADVSQVVVIEVADSGPGIPAELLPQIFDPFVTTKVKGTGLGLSVSRQLVEQQGGRLEAAAALGDGALFRVTLPVAPADQFTPR
jgi:nitrogen-specific signal transduction histidine kinase